MDLFRKLRDAMEFEKDRPKLLNLLEERLRTASHAQLRRVVLALVHEPEDDGPEVSILSVERTNG